jgi:putative ABC transport system substrate-binding protein
VRRRKFLAGLGGAIVWPVVGLAQQSATKIPTIGFLGSGTEAAQRTWVASFIQRLGELGWVDGRTTAIEYRWGEGRVERFNEIASEFVRLRVDVIFALGTEAALAAKQATGIIPIIFPIAGDPVSTGMVTSLARPGGNITGLSNQATDLAAKRLGLLREVFPTLRSIAIMANGDSSAAVLEMHEFEAATGTLGLKPTLLSVRNTQDIAPAFESIKGRAEALYVVGDPLMNFNRVRINSFALSARLPTMHGTRESVEWGGLISYGPSYSVQFRRAAELVDKILRGAKPGDIPVEQPTKFDLIVNLITAQALGLTVPATLLARADEVIE